MIGMASDFLADEVLHTELAARVAMELGGAAPIAVDMERFAFRSDPRLPARQRANEIILRVCCVGESFEAARAIPNAREVALDLLAPLERHGIRLGDEARATLFS